jgi:hypothetical protein
MGHPVWPNCRSALKLWVRPIGLNLRVRVGPMTATLPLTQISDWPSYSREMGSDSFKTAKTENASFCTNMCLLAQPFTFIDNQYQLPLWNSSIYRYSLIIWRFHASWTPPARKGSQTRFDFSGIFRNSKNRIICLQRIMALLFRDINKLLLLQILWKFQLHRITCPGATDSRLCHFCHSGSD